MARTSTTASRAPHAALLLLALVALGSGCVRRTISITSDPAGALVILNDREVGRTPVEVDFVYYGTYDVRVLHDGYEPFVGNAKAKSPLWDTMPLDFFAELTPAQLDAKVEWHFTLLPSAAAGVVERAEAAREQAGR